jgi:D-aminopeptidase
MDESLQQSYRRAARKRCRLRDLGIVIGKHPTGDLNTITDVPGVRVGHCTVVEGSGRKSPGKGPVRTGVTVILPSERVYDEKLVAGAFILNGAGEVAGLTQLSEWGLIETPIALTNTMSVGQVSDGAIKWMANKYAKLWDEREVVIPIVGECDDSFLNDAIGFHIAEEHVKAAFRAAKPGPVTEGAVGSGTGMICCDLKGGIGTSSRRLEVAGTQHTLGVLVMSNFGVLEDLRVDGFPIGQILASTQVNDNRRKRNYGSIIVIIATDIPLSATQITRICKRSALGIGRVGTYAAHGSGEIIVGFSTGNVVRPGARNHKYKLTLIADEYLNQAYQAVIEATEEAILNSLTAAVEMEGVDGHRAPAIDLHFLKSTMADVRGVLARHCDV